MKKVWTVLAIVALAAYPLLVFTSLQTLGVRSLAVMLLLLLGLRMLASWYASRQLHWLTVLPVLLTAIAIVLPALWFNRGEYLRFYPVLVNAIFLIVFASSLLAKRTIIENIARITEPDLPEETVIYTRNVTQVWCCFFVLNGSIALYTALKASFSFWAFYNGFIAYIFMGMLFAGEFIVRFFFRRRLALKISQSLAKPGEML